MKIKTQVVQAFAYRSWISSFVNVFRRACALRCSGVLVGHSGRVSARAKKYNSFAGLLMGSLYTDFSSGAMEARQDRLSLIDEIIEGKLLTPVILPASLLSETLALKTFDSVVSGVVSQSGNTIQIISPENMVNLFDDQSLNQTCNQNQDHTQEYVDERLAACKLSADYDLPVNEFVQDYSKVRL